MLDMSDGEAVRRRLERLELQVQQLRQMVAALSRRVPPTEAEKREMIRLYEPPAELTKQEYDAEFVEPKR